ncbi:MAG: Holliday junction resolvase RuvX [Patescibacteria group bacterium]|jgi:putative Holliday junction resolvase
MRILGVDYGESKIGIALGDTETRIASPWMILENQGHGESIKQIKLIFENEKAERIVVGIPVSLKNPGQENEQVRTIKRFIADLRTQNIPVDEQNEMLSSAQAAYYMHQTGSKNQDDAVAASIMLEAYLQRAETDN